MLINKSRTYYVEEQWEAINCSYLSFFIYFFISDFNSEIHQLIVGTMSNEHPGFFLCISRGCGSITLDMIASILNVQNIVIVMNFLILVNIALTIFYFLLYFHRNSISARFILIYTNAKFQWHKKRIA